MYCRTKATLRGNKMEEPNNIPNSETDLSDSWTVVNSDDSEGIVNTEIAETSDSESLEVLEVEQEELDQNSQDLEIVGEENGDEECTIKDCDDSFLLEDPLIHLASIQKVRKYVHHPSAYVNMWLSVVMVIAIAVTFGLGIGHYLGSKRFGRAKDMIHHLKYENRMLEQELADVVMKHKYCENDLHNRVRQLIELKESKLVPIGTYSSSYYFQANMFANLIQGNEDVCYAEENALNANFFKDSLLSDTGPPFLQWFSYIKVDSDQNPDFPFVDEFISNRSDISTDNNNNTSGEDLHSELEVINNKINSSKSHFSFSKLSSCLTYLHSLLKKWKEFHENLKLLTSVSKTESLEDLQNTDHLSEVARKVMPLVSGSPFKLVHENVNHLLVNSSNDFCRSKINHCILHEEKLQNKDKKCKALSKAQLLCSLLQRSNKKQRNIFLLGKQKKQEKKDKNAKVQKFSFVQNRYKKIEKTKFSHEGRKSGENGKVNIKMINFSIPASKWRKNKNKMENSPKAVKSKENNHKFKYTPKDQNIKKKDNTRYQTRKPFKKQTSNNLPYQQKQPSKSIPKLPKQFKKYYAKEIFKNEGKRSINWSKDKRKYSEKFSSMKNRKKTEDFKKCSNNKRDCKYINDKKMTKDEKYFASSKFGASKNPYNYYSKEISIIDNRNGKNVKDFKKCSNDKEHCKFHMNNKKITEGKKYAHSKFDFLENSKYKTKENKKHDSENASCKYPLNVHPKDKNFHKYWKMRSKMYEINMQDMKIFKT